ncbi:MAG TPA: Clp protease N-terminal domain-containing protein, partial [Oscillatoriaceae cyanobacterium]
MLCDECRRYPATMEFRRSVDGRHEIRQLCRRCAEGAVEQAEPPELFSNPRRRAGVLARLSEDAEDVMQSAARLALEWGYDRLGAEMVLAALAGVGGPAAEALREASLTPERLDLELATLLPRREVLDARELTLTARLQTALDLADQAAREQGLDTITPEHLLIGILQEGGSLGAQLMQDQNLTVAQLSARFGLKPAKRRRAGLPEQLAR